MPEIEKALAELKRLMVYRAKYNTKPRTTSGEEPMDVDSERSEGQMEDILAIGLSSRKNMCIHPVVSQERKGKVVDARCRDMTSAWACEKGRQNPGSVELCDFHEVRQTSLKSGTWKAGTGPTCTTRRLDDRRGERVWTRQGHLPIFCGSPNDALL